MDCSLPGSSVHGIFQARVLEWGAIAFSDSRLYFLPKSIISGSLQGFNPLDLRLQGFIPFLFFGSTAPSVLLWFWPRLCLQAALVSVPHPDKRAWRPRSVRAHLLNGTVKRVLADTTGMYQGVPATIETCQMLLQSEVGCTLPEKFNQGLGSLGRAKLLGVPARCGQYLCLLTAWELLPPPGQGHHSVLSTASGTLPGFGSCQWPMFPPLGSQTAVMSNSAAGAPTSSASFASRHQARRCCLRMREVRVPQQEHPVFFLDSLSCTVLALMAANPSPLPGAWSLSLSLSKFRLRMQVCNMLLSWEVLASNNLCCEFSPFCLLSTWCYISFWSSEAHPWFCPWVDFWVCTNFSSFMTPSSAHRCPEILYHFIFCPTSF